MLLRDRFLGGLSQHALRAAEDGAGQGAPGATPPASTTPSVSSSAAASSPVAATDAPGVGREAVPVALGSTAAGTPASAPGATESPAVVAPAEAAPAEPSSTSLIADAPAKAPGEAEAPAPAKPDGKDAKTETPAPAETKADAPKDAKADDKAPAPAEAEALAETPPAHTYEAFKVPDGLKLDDERVKTFTTILDDAKATPQERGQKLIDLFVDEVGKVQKARDVYQRETFDKLQNSWKDELRKDPEVGGNRMETALGLSKWVIEQFGGTKQQQSELLAQLSYTGMGNNVGIVRLLNNLANMLSEGEIVPASPRPAKDTRSRGERWYGNNGSQN